MRPKDTKPTLSASHDVFHWIPAFAGMTVGLMEYFGIRAVID